MKNRIFYILMSTTLTTFAFALSACSGGGGAPTLPQKQNLLNTTLNQKGAPSQWNGGKPTPSPFPSGTKFTIINPKGNTKIQKTSVGGGNSSRTASSADSTRGGLDKAVGPAPTSTSASSSGVITASASSRAQSTVHASLSAPQLEKIQPRVIAPISTLPSLPKVDLMSPASAKNFRATSNIKVVMQDSHGHKEVLRNIPGKELTATAKMTPKVASAKTANCPSPKSTAKKSSPHKGPAQKLVQSKQKAVDTKYVDRYDKLPVHVIWYSEQFNLWNPQKVPFGTCLMSSAVNGNSSGAVTPEKSSFSALASNYDSYTPSSVFYKFSSNPAGISPENTACDVSVTDSNNYQNLPCLVFQKDTVAPGVEHETAYLLYVERKFDGSFKVVRKDDRCLTDAQSIRHAYEKQFVKNFLAGELDGTYILSFKHYKSNPNQK